MTNRPPLLGDEVEAQAFRWAGPYGVAVLYVLRQTDYYSDADFLSLMAQASLKWAGMTMGPNQMGALLQEAPPRESFPPVQTAPHEPRPDQASMTNRPWHKPKLQPRPALAVEGTRGYRPAGQRDQSGRYVQPVQNR